MKSRIIVSAVIRNEDKILLARKPAGKGPYPDTWHIPGGGVDPEKETCEEALIREIKEETGLKVDNIKKVAWDSDTIPDKNGIETYYVFLQFTCDTKEIEINVGDDLHHLEWVSIDELSKYNLNKPSRILFNKLRFL